MGFVFIKCVGVAGLNSTRFDPLKGNRIGPPLFIYQNYITNISNLQKIVEMQLSRVLNNFINDHANDHACDHRHAYDYYLI